MRPTKDHTGIHKDSRRGADGVRSALDTSHNPGVEHPRSAESTWGRSATGAQPRGRAEVPLATVVVVARGGVYSEGPAQQLDPPLDAHSHAL